MEIGLYTDSVPELTLDGVLDFAVDIGAGAVEIAAGGQSSAPHRPRAWVAVPSRKVDAGEYLDGARTWG